MIIYKGFFTIAVVKYKSPYETLAVMLLVQKINFLCGREVVRTGSESRSHGLADQYNVKVTTVQKSHYPPGNRHASSY